MTDPRRLKSLSDTTRRYLAAGEGQRVDFKRGPDGISADDLVSFANSAEGGTILAGVDEKTADGTQVGVVRGCDVGDNAILQLLNKAISCLPPVSVDIAIENLSDKPILRISIPSSPTKPHCTPKGVYCRREGSRNRALHPTELLSIFLENEARVFAERFESAADHITQEIGNLEESLAGTIRSMSDQLGWADSNISDTASTIDDVLAYTKRMNAQTNDIATRMRTLFRQDSRDDPVRNREMDDLIEAFVEQIWEDRKLLKGVIAGQPFQFTLKGKYARELSEDEGRAAFAEASRIVRERYLSTIYTTRVSAPADCPPEIIKEVAGLLVEVGEPASIGSLETKLRRCFLIGFTTYKETVVAVAALKKPKAAARAAVFERDGASADHIRFKLQLDWMAIHPDHHGKGQLSRLVEELLGSIEGKPVFALIERRHSIVHDLLLRASFHPATPDPGDTVTDGDARLYLRDEA